MNLDELIPDDYELLLFNSEGILRNHITGKELKAAIRSEMQEQIRQAMKVGLKVDGRHYTVRGQFIPSRSNYD